jgi:hypothetical protein
MGSIICAQNTVKDTYNPATYSGANATILIQPQGNCVNDTALIRYARPDGGVEAVFGFVQSQYGAGTADFIIQGSSCGYSEKFRIAGNNVGIGTCEPLGKLHVQNGQIRIHGAPSDSITGTMGFYLANSGNTEAYNWQMSCNFNLGLWTFSNTAGGGWGLRGPVITQLGNVGIGCSIPQTRLHVTDQAAYGIATFDSSANGGYLIFQQTGVTKAYIQWGLTVAGSANGNYMLVTNDASCGSIALQTKSPTGCNNSAALVVGCTGNVGVGTCAPTYRLHVNGTFYAAGSSQDYKQSICNYNTDSCMFMKLKPVTYQYKDEYCHLGKELKSGTQIGLIAEEVAESHPELAILVNEEDEKVVRNVDYEKLTIILLSELQKLRQEVDQLKNK